MKPWRKLQRLWLDVVLLPAILVLVVSTRVALSVLPFPTLRRVLDHFKGLQLGWRGGLSPERVTWMVRKAASFVPGATCLTQAIVTELLYEFCGEAAKTCFGVSRKDGRLEAHAWVESGGKVILGASEAGKFTPLLH